MGMVDDWSYRTLAAGFIGGLWTAGLIYAFVAAAAPGDVAPRGSAAGRPADYRAAAAWCLKTMARLPAGAANR
jgi:hypothetical protein